MTPDTPLATANPATTIPAAAVPATAGQDNYHVDLGGALSGTPEPPEPFFPLRQDQFLTLRDGEMSEFRSMRDACIGAFVAAVVGIAGLLAVINWDTSIRQQKVPLAAMAILCIGAAAALIVGLVQQRHITRTLVGSAYSRLLIAIEKKFGITSKTA
jgi:hypothetical protein